MRGMASGMVREYRATLIFSEAKDFAVLGEKSVKGQREMYTIGA